MNIDQEFRKALLTIRRRDKRYSEDAYIFVRYALDYTTKTMEIKGHVTGQELLEGIRQYTLKQFGPMSNFMLEEWGITSCEDFGNIVFNMVDNGILGKTEQDSMTDFMNGYNFHEAFQKPFQ